MNKKMCAIMIAILVVMPLLALTQRVQASGTTVSLQPNQYNTIFYVNPGQTINLTLSVQNVIDLWSWKVDITWNDSILQLAPTGNVTEGPFLQSAGTTLFMESPPKVSGSGTLAIGNIQELSSTLLVNSTASGSGNLAYIAFVPQYEGNTTITITGVEMEDNHNVAIDPASTSLTITIRLTGDINGDTVVDGADIALIAYSFGSYGPGYLYSGSPPSSNWNQYADVNHDGVVDGSDIALAALNFGHWWYPPA